MFENFTLDELLRLRQGVETHYSVVNGVFKVSEVDNSNYVFKKFNRIMMSLNKGESLINFKKDTLEVIDAELKRRHEKVSMG
jgi:hypothetical protein